MQVQKIISDYRGKILAQHMFGSGYAELINNLFLWRQVGALAPSIQNQDDCRVPIQPGASGIFGSSAL